jgi:hypothetical protein
VIYEAGYAMKALGQDNVIFVADSRTTNTNNLPFDIRNRIMILTDFSKPVAVRKEVVEVVKTVTATYSPPDPNNGAPSIQLVQDTAKWASNWSGFGASFEVIMSVDNYRGRSNYITNARILGTNADGSSFATDSVRFGYRGQPDHSYALAADVMDEVPVYVGLDRDNHRPMPDLDRDTTELEVTFRTGKVVRVPIKVVPNG